MPKKVDYMSKAEFSRAIALMNKMRDEETLDLVDFMQSDVFVRFGGFALPDFEPVACSLRDLAKLICYQCLQFNGELDTAALDEIWQSRRRFLIVGEGSDEVERKAEMTVLTLNMIDNALMGV